MTSEVKYESQMFNACPLCEMDKGERHWLEYKSEDGYSDPCPSCGTRYGAFLVPSEDQKES